MARNDPGLEGFNLIYQYWARDDFVNTDAVSHVYSTWSDVNKHNISEDCAAYNDQD